MRQAKESRFHPEGNGEALKGFKPVEEGDSSIILIV